MKMEAKILANRKIRHLNTVFNLILTQFRYLIQVLPADYNDNIEKVVVENYEMLEISHLQDQFIEEFSEKLE